MIRWGVIGLGNIAKRFASSLMQIEEGQLYAAASYTKEKREQFNELFHPEVIYDTYEELLKDPNIDAVYIALPHALHKEYSIKALQGKKAVLCEKPAALHSEELKEIIRVAQENDVFYMEAIKSRFIPLMEDIKTLLENKAIGDVLSLKANFDFLLPKQLPTKSYYIDDVQGGALFDVGTYLVNIVVDLFGKDITTISSTMKPYLTYAVDGFFEAKLTYGNGMVATIEGAFDRNSDKAAIIEGTKGSIILPRFYRCEEAIIKLNDGGSDTIKKPLVIDDMAGEIKEVHKCLLLGKKESSRLSFSDSLFMMKLLDCIRRDAVWIV